MKKSLLLVSLVAGFVSTSVMAASVTSLGQKDLQHVVSVTWLQKGDAESFSNQFDCGKVKTTKRMKYSKVSFAKCGKPVTALGLQGVQSVTLDDPSAADSLGASLGLQPKQTKHRHYKLVLNRGPAVA